MGVRALALINWDHYRDHRLEEFWEAWKKVVIDSAHMITEAHLLKLLEFHVSQSRLLELDVRSYKL